MEDNGPKASDKPGTMHISVSVHLRGSPHIAAKEERHGGDGPYTVLDIGQRIDGGVTVFVRDPEHLRTLAHVAMRSALRLERLLEAAKAPPDTGVTDADVEAALADADALPPREDWTSEQAAAVDRIAGVVEA